MVTTLPRATVIPTTAIGRRWCGRGQPRRLAAETLASRVPKAEEYIARVPAIAIVPWSGRIAPIGALLGLEPGSPSCCR